MTGGPAPTGLEPDRSGPPGQLVVRRADVELTPDARRVIARLFLPGQEGTDPGISRAAGVVRRCLALGEHEARELLAGVVAAFGDRHHDLTEIFEEHFAAVAHRVERPDLLSPTRRRLIGAYFTQEFSIESAALFNPSIVPHPVQDGPPGSLRFVMSARAVGEGHLSSVVFRSGVVGPGTAATAVVTLDPGSAHVVGGRRLTPLIDLERFGREARIAAVESESLAFVLNQLPAAFTETALDEALVRLHRQGLTRVHADETDRILRGLVDGWYEVEFGPHSVLAERTLLPAIPREGNGIEDVRFVRFVEDDGTFTYLATYTAYDGRQVSGRRLRTDDFVTFRSSGFTGRAAQDKGMALFPRRVGGRYLALSRWDRENTTLATSTDGHHWPDSTVLQTPTQPWELIQLGNCGSPIETPDGWLVLTHGVGPVRSYAIGALLLDLDDPSRVIGRLRTPLLTPAADERDGYVPNVVYSCGALVHDGVLVLPYGCSDSRLRFALLDLADVLERLQASNGS